MNIEEKIEELRQQIPASYYANTRSDTQERDKRNAYLRKEGYAWKKNFAGRWELVGPDGADHSKRVKEVLVKLGYYGDIPVKELALLQEWAEAERNVTEEREASLKLREDREKLAGVVVNLEWRDGEYLSAWVPGDSASYGIFESTAILKPYYPYVSGWGNRVKGVEGLPSFKREGTKASFLIDELIEKAEARKKAVDEKRRAAERSVLQKQAEALAKAKRTGKMVYIRSVGGYDGDYRYPGEELGWVNVSEYATPGGEIVTRESPSY